MSEDYTPYGEEWNAEMMRMTKPQLVAYLRRVLFQHQAYSALGKVEMTDARAQTIAANVALNPANNYTQDQIAEARARVAQLIYGAPESENQMEMRDD